MRSSRQASMFALAKRNRGKKSFFDSNGIQPKLQDGQAGDVYEQQANAAENWIMNPDATGTFFKPAPQSIQKKGDGSGGAASSVVHDGISSTGQPLDVATKNFMEPKFGYDFSNVKVHNNNSAHQSAESINALAYTHGNNIVFGAGQYQPETNSGKQLLAHELVHVVQQQGQPSVQRKPRNDKADKASEMFDNDIDDFRRNYHLKVIFNGFDGAQKEPIKAVKDGSAIGVTIGQAYIDEAEDGVRKAMLRAEIIGKFVTNDRFEDLANDPTHAKLNEMNPPYRAGQYCTLNCPATAESLGEYLKTGNIKKAYCNPVIEGNGKGYGFDISTNTFSNPLSWKQAETAIKKQLTKHGDFVVVEAKRTPDQMKQLHISEKHYFTVVNVKGTLFAIDASMGGIVSSDLQGFIDNNIIANTYRLAKGEFKVKLVIL